MKLEQRRRLTDLYARGEEVALDDKGEIVVWVRKMTPADAEVAYLKASAKRSSILALGKQETPSDLYEMMKGECDLLTKDSLVIWLASSVISTQTPLIEARVANAEEWSEERYLESLQERFMDYDFQKKLAENPEDEEVVRVMGELERYQGQVDEEVLKFSKETEAQLQMDPEEELRAEVLESMLDAQANAAWLNEFARCQIWRCTFEEDHVTPVWSQRKEVDEVQGEVLAKLAAVIDRIHVPDAEGKDSEQTQTLSLPSDSQGQPATDQVSSLSE
jgi:hypothetical protein